MPASLPDILPLEPHLRPTVWGGRRLGERFGKDLPPDVPVGESLEVSALPGAESVVRSGPLAGRGLAGLAEEFGEALVGAPVRARYGDEFPLLIKLIDAAEDLSIQVHPDDGYARREGLGAFGKTEAWYVLESGGSSSVCARAWTAAAWNRPWPPGAPRRRSATARWRPPTWCCCRPARSTPWGAG